MLLELHTWHCIHYISGKYFYLTLYLPCFFLCLQFKQKIGPQPQPQLNACDDDEDDTSVPSSTPETAPHTAFSSTAAATAVPSTSTAGVSKKFQEKGSYSCRRPGHCTTTTATSGEVTGRCWRAVSACHPSSWANKQQISMGNISS